MKIFATALLLIAATPGQSPKTTSTKPAPPAGPQMLVSQRTTSGHIVSLQWTNPTPIPPQTTAASNVIYRSVGCSSTYTKINSVTAVSPTTTYSDMDPSLANGNTYCYQVSAVDKAGVENPQRTNVTQVIIPKASVCSPTTPCAALTLSNSSMSATIVSSGGTQTSGPGIAILWSCMGGATNCSQANLNTNIQQLASGQPVQGYWGYVSFPQTTSSVTYLDQQPPGSLMNYANSNQWNSSNAATGAAAGPVSAITIFTLPVAPAATVPGAPAAPVVTPNTTGTPGPQSQKGEKKPKPQARPKQPAPPSAKGSTTNL